MDLSPPDGFWILGHRGARRSKPENTIASFEAAMDQGADGVEWDVRATKDGGLVVHHDATRRVGGRARRLADLLPAQLPSRVPRLDEALAWARTRGAVVDVELKEAGAEEAVAGLLGAHPKTVVTSFLPDVLFAMRQAMPNAVLGWITKERGPEVIDLARELNVPFVVLPSRNLSAGLVGGLRKAGTRVWAWGVNGARDAKRSLDLGVEGLITDEPRRLAAWREARGRRRTSPGTDRRGS